MSRAIPETLVKEVGLDALLERLPVPYQKALFSSYVGSRFVSYFVILWVNASHGVPIHRSISMVSTHPVSTFSTSLGTSQELNTRPYFILIFLIAPDSKNARKGTPELKNNNRVYYRLLDTRYQWTYLHPLRFYLNFPS